MKPLFIVIAALVVSLPAFSQTSSVEDQVRNLDKQQREGALRGDESAFLERYAAANYSFTELVRGAIQQRLTGHRPAVEDVARDLHISSRTLQRRLQEAGSSYQRVLDEARHQMARYYLGNSVLELTEAAYLLGYEDANSFVRAFRTWEGIPPGLWRESQRSIKLN